MKVDFSFSRQGALVCITVFSVLATLSSCASKSDSGAPDSGSEDLGLAASSKAAVTCTTSTASYFCGSQTAYVSNGLPDTLYKCGTTIGAAPTSSTACAVACLINPGANDSCGKSYVADATTLSVASSPNLDASFRLLWANSGTKKGGTSLPTAAGAVSAVYGTATITTSGANQCAAFAQKVSGVGLTSTWRKGPQAIAACPPAGTVVATLASGAYPSTSQHAGMVIACSSSSLKLLDSNYIDYTSTATALDHVGVHTISKTSTGKVSDAAAYYVVYAP